jgi:WD40 repeat protein
VHHKDRVRSVIWNSELPWMLITGSDDSMIVIWDTRSSKVVTSTYEPTLSLTSFTSHPQRPFTLVSSHFDSSIIIWSLLSLPEVALSQLKFLLGVNLNEIFSTPEESLMSEQMKLTGAQSRQVSD